MLLLCWALLLGLATRPVALLLCALAPPIVLSGVAPDRFEVTLLLLLLVAKGAGWLSLDGLAVRWASTGLRWRALAAGAVPHVAGGGGGLGATAAVRPPRWPACGIPLIAHRTITCSSRSYTRWQPRRYRRPISRSPFGASYETSATWP